MNTKHHYTLRRAVLAVAILAAGWLNAAALRTPATQDIRLTFGARGESNSVDEVRVENLSNGRYVDAFGTDTLVLDFLADPNGIELVEATPMPQGTARISGGALIVNTATPTYATVAAFTTAGTQVSAQKAWIAAGQTTVSLPALPQGIYIVSVSGANLRNSVKWMSRGATAAAAMTIAHGGDSETQPERTEAPTHARNATNQAPHYAAAKPRLVSLPFKRGDVLRFTGKSGTMTTVMTLAPRTSHPVYFDFFRCEDAAGNNYAIVRAGDMMWMAENMKAVTAEGVADVSDLPKEEFDKRAADGSAAIMAVDKSTKNAYYSRKAAEKALPEGWRLPTQGELDGAIKKINGGNYSSVGRLLKEGTSAEADGTALQIALSGFYDGAATDGGNGYILTRNTTGGVPMGLRVNGGDDKASFVKAEKCLLPVRGVRPAPSAYTEMLEMFGYATKRQSAEHAVAAEAENEAQTGPLGNIYTMFSGAQSVAYDFTGPQYGDYDGETRNGILYKNPPSTEFNLIKGDAYDKDYGGNRQLLSKTFGNPNFLRKMAPMANGSGTQNIVETTWHPDDGWTYLWTTMKQKRSDTPAGFCDGYVGIIILGDKASGYKTVADYDDYNYTQSGGVEVRLPKKMTLRPFVSGTLPYFLYDDSNRATETRADYVQRVFQLLTADFNDDGVDDIVVHMDGQIAIYDGKKVLAEMAKIKTKSQVLSENTLMCYKEFNTGANFSKYYMKKAMTRIAVGDATGDGKPDIVVLRVGGGGTKGKSAAQLMIFSKGNLETSPVADGLIAENWTNAVFNDIKVGNVSGGKYNDIIVLKRDYSGTTIAKKGYLWRVMYDPNDAADHLYSESGDDYCVWSFRGYDGHMGNSNITLAHFRGKEYPADIVVGADMWRWDEGDRKLKYKFQVLPFVDDQIWSIFADNIIAADPEGTGRDFLYYFRNWSTYRNSQRYAIQGFSETYFSNRSGDVSASTLKHNHEFNSKMFKYCESGKIWSNDFNREDELMYSFTQGDWEYYSNSALCAVFDRPGSKTLKYKGHQKAFSEPRIHALIAAPPTYDYGTETEPNYDFVTSWGYSTSQSQQTTKSSSISASTIVGFEYEFNAPLVGTKLGGVDFTATMQSECSKGTTESSSVAYSQLYEARDDDRVVLQVTPYDSYTYEVVNSSNIDEIGGEVNLAVPQKPLTLGIALTDYDRVMGDAPGAPDLHEVFTHEIGDPFSYPSTASEIKTNVKGSAIMWGNGRWDDFVTTGSGGSVIREIALDNSTAQTAAFSFSVESELVVTAGCVKAGFGFGYGKTNETTHEESSGFAVSACVPGLAPGDRNPNRTFFDWNLCWYKYCLGGQTFPVVNYVVKKR